MNGKILFALVSTGKRPVVKITGPLWDESWGDKGMLAEVVSATAPDSDGCMSFKFDYNKFRDMDLPLQSHDWFTGPGSETGTAFEAGVMDEKDINEEVIFGETDDIPVEVVTEGLLGEYVKSGAMELGVTYTAWLEDRCESQSAALKVAEEMNKIVLREVQSLKTDIEKYIGPDKIVPCPKCGHEIHV